MQMLPLSIKETLNNHQKTYNMKNLSNYNVQEISFNDQKQIHGGDNITQAVFNYLGQVWKGIRTGEAKLMGYGY